jgi:hypothetical protein
MACTSFALGSRLCQIKNFTNSKVNQKVGGWATQSLCLRALYILLSSLAPFVRLNFARIKKAKVTGET